MASSLTAASGKSPGPAQWKTLPWLGVYPRWVRVELVREQRGAEYRAGTLRDADNAAIILGPLLRREPTATFLVLHAGR